MLNARKNASISLAPEATLFGVFELLEEFFLFLAEVLRGFDDDGDDVGAAVAVGTEGNAVTAELEWRTGLGAGGDFHGDFAIDGFDFDFGAEGGVNHVDVLFGKNDGAFTSEMLVRFDFDADVEVAGFGGAFWGGAAFAAESDGHAVVDAGGDFDFEVLAFYSDRLGGAEDGFFEGQRDGGLVVGAATRAMSALGTKETAEDVIKNRASATAKVETEGLAAVVESAAAERIAVCEGVASATEWITGATDTGVAELVVAGAFLLVA